MKRRYFYIDAPALDFVNPMCSLSATDIAFLLKTHRPNSFDLYEKGIYTKSIMLAEVSDGVIYKMNSYIRLPKVLQNALGKFRDESDKEEK